MSISLSLCLFLSSLSLSPSLICSLSYSVFSSPLINIFIHRPIEFYIFRLSLSYCLFHLSPLSFYHSFTSLSPFHFVTLSPFSSSPSHIISLSLASYSVTLSTLLLLADSQILLSLSFWYIPSVTSLSLTCTENHTHYLIRC